MTQTSTRRLAAVLIADVAGYSRLMEQDEAGTHARLATIRAEVTDPAVRSRGGRIVRSVGDGILVEFASAAAALQAAIEIQRAMADRNRGLPPQQRLDHRIGINLGDILVEEHDIAGTGVNVAARLEAIAPPGGIAISGTVRDQVRDDLGVGFVDLGPQPVKNISRPLRVYRVELDGPPTLWARLRSRRRFGRVAAAAVLASLIVAAVFVLLPRPPEPAPHSLVVLPLASPAASPTARAAADALTRQLTGAMSQLTELTVIAPTVADRYADQRGDMARIGNELKVRYALDGRVEQAGDQVRVAVHLVDTGSGGSLWSAEQKAPFGPGGDLPASLVVQLSESLRAAIRAAELKRLRASRVPPDAYAIALAAIEDLQKNSPGRAELTAIRMRFEQALQLDPQHPLALNGYAHALRYEADYTEPGPQRDALLQRADEVSLRAVALRPDDAEAWSARANVLYFRGQFESAAEAVRRGLALNPYLVPLQAWRGQILLALGQGEEALAAFERGIELNLPGVERGVLLHLRSRALLLLGRHAEAIESCERSIAFGPEWPDYMVLTAAYALQGDHKRADRARAELMRLQPAFTIRWHEAMRGVPGAPTQFERVLYAGLRQAGVPE